MCEEEDNSPARFQYTTAFRKFARRIRPEVKDIHREDGIKAVILIGEFSCIAERQLHMLLHNGPVVALLGYREHRRRVIDTGNVSMRRQTYRLRNRFARPEADFQEVI